MPSADRKTVHGAAVAGNDPELFRAAFGLGVWLPRELYALMPVLLPHVVRDNGCRNKGQDRVDEWAWPSSEGYLRDDNSRVKNLVTYHGSVLTVGSSQNPAMVDAGLAGGYTACHVWPDTHPERNTFVANLVWLPTVISRLSDTQGGQGFASHAFLQALAHSLYSHVESHPAVASTAERVWGALGTPAIAGLPPLPDERELNWFRVTTGWVEARHRELASMVAALRRHAAGEELHLPGERLASGMSRYLSQLHRIPPAVAAERAAALGDYYERVRLAWADARYRAALLGSSES